MIKFKSLLKENPDTVYYKKRTYNYVSPANRCAFFVYKDKLSGKRSLFGYSDNKKEFYSNDPEVLADVKDLKDGEQIEYPQGGNFENDAEQNLYWSQQAVKKLEHGNNGGGHLQLENVLQGLERWETDDDLILKGRIFLVDEASGSEPFKPNLDIQIESTIPSGKSIIVSFWSYNKSNVTPYKDQIDKVIEFNGYKPEECLYELGSDVMTFNQLYDKEEPKPVKPIAPSQVSNDVAHNTFKPGDKVKIKGLNIKADVLSTTGKNEVNLKVTQSDMAVVPVGSEFPYFSYGLELDSSESVPLLDKVIDDKTREFVDKRGKLHTTGAAFTPAEKANLEKEVDSLEIEIKILNDLLNSGEKYYTDNVKNVVSTSVQRKLHAKEKEKLDRYSLAAQAEKQYGMPIAQIRQKYRGVPLDKLVKKESLYRKLLKALKG